MSKIKNVIFDLGAVLMNLDYNLTITAFKELGYTNFETMYTQFRADKIFDGLETGHISETAFYDYILEAGNEKITKNQVLLAWNAMLLDFRAESFEFLKKLGKTHRLFLLSNTNTIHKTAFEGNFTKQTGWPSIDDFFSKAYYSHLVGMRKPNENIFKFILEDAGMNPGETLFIDDLPDNINTAAGLGIKTHLFMPGERVEKLDYQ